MEQALHHTFGRPLGVEFNSVCLPEFDQPTCSSTLNLALDHGKKSDVYNFAGSGSGHLDVIDSVVSHDGASQTPEQTGVKSFDDDDDVYGSHFRDPMLEFDKLSQDLYDGRPHKGSYDGLANIASNILVKGQAFTDGEVVDATSGFTEAGSNKDPLAIEPEQSVGPGRHYHLLGTSDATQGPSLVEATSTQPNRDRVSNWVFASWPRPKESISEDTEIIQRANELGELRDPTLGNHLQGAETPLHGTKSASAYRPSVTAMHKLLAAMTACSTLSMYETRLAARFSTVEDKKPPMGAHWKTYSSPSSAARQIRVHESPQGVIQRMMPLDRTIRFDMDTESFRRAGVEANDMDRIIKAACMVTMVFGVQKLGITFAYAPGRSPKVFSIRYDPKLSRTVAADSFFPSDPRENWQVRISPAALPSWSTSGDPWYMTRTLAHEFMHILGFRHHNAGSNEGQLSSMHWPGTVDGDSQSIMYTSVHPELWFSEEDMRAIQEFYSRPNMTLMRDRWVVMDVDPYDGSRAL